MSKILSLDMQNKKPKKTNIKKTKKKKLDGFLEYVMWKSRNRFGHEFETGN